ncbi:hypothetical protein [Dickeya undicola]|uniref:Uncharacterized protein n=1 Tax=Dickeya undicola TaxID=1577887 RepID=A0A3N0G660_9GAMM|nr:hypothetical protein [Dickeya undicola]RNM07726.1 hypothetical protein EF878_07270 [Dickeya undicola]
MTELTKEALTDAIRSAAVKAASTDERRVLNYAAGEIERQGNEIEHLKSYMRELTEAMNRARRTAKELGEENHALRNPASTEKITAQLEELKYTRVEPNGWTCKTLAHGRVTDDVAESWNGAIDAAILTIADWDALCQAQQEPITFDVLRNAVAEITGGLPQEWDTAVYKGHQPVPFINFNSLSRIVERFRNNPAPAVPDELMADKAYQLLMEKGGVASPVEATVFGWRACRDEMLQSSGNSEQLKPSLDTAKLFNKFYERYPLETFACDGDRAQAAGYFMSGAEIQCFGQYIDRAAPRSEGGAA